MSAKLTHRQAHAKYASYAIGFVLSVAATLLAYFLVVDHVFPKEALIYTVLGVAVVQLIVQLVFFLHINKGWRLITLLFAVLVVLVVVVGSLWIMNNLNYNMMTMTPDQMNQYMKDNEGI